MEEVVKENADAVAPKRTIKSVLADYETQLKDLGGTDSPQKEELTEAVRVLGKLQEIESYTRPYAINRTAIALLRVADNEWRLPEEAEARLEEDLRAMFNIPPEAKITIPPFRSTLEAEQFFFVLMADPNTFGEGAKGHSARRWQNSVKGSVGSLSTRSARRKLNTEILDGREDVLAIRRVYAKKRKRTPGGLLLRIEELQNGTNWLNPESAVAREVSAFVNAALAKHMRTFSYELDEYRALSLLGPEDVKNLMVIFSEQLHIPPEAVTQLFENISSRLKQIYGDAQSEYSAKAFDELFTSLYAHTGRDRVERTVGYTARLRSELTEDNAPQEEV